MIRISKGKTYFVGEQGGKSFFAWSKEYSFFDNLPAENFNDEESGVKWFKTYEDAFNAYIDATKKEEI